MALTSEQRDVILNLILEEHGTIDAIASLDKFSDKVRLTSQLLHNLAVQSKSTAQEVAEAMKSMESGIALEAPSAPLIGDKAIQAASQKEYVASLSAELSAKEDLVAKNQQLTPTQIAVNNATVASTKATELSSKGITAQTATIDDYKGAISELSNELGVGYPKATSMLEKTSLGAAGGTAKLRKALQELGNEATASSEKIKEDFIKKALGGMKTQLQEIQTAAGDAPGQMIKPIANLSLEMEKLTNIPAQDWARAFGKELGFSRGAVQATAQEIDIMKNGIAGTAKQAINLSSILNTAFGVGMAMLIFSIVKGIQELVSGFKAAIDASNELRQNLLKLGSAERILSEMGGSITPQDMDELINRLNKQFVLTPRIDIVSGLKKLAIEVAPLGYGRKEIEELMMAALLKQIESPEKTLDQIIEPMTTALFGGALKGLQGLSFNINDERIRLRATELGLWDELDGKISRVARQQAIYSIIVGDTLIKQEALSEAQDKSVFASLRLSAAWSDFKENIGSFFAPFWNNFLESVENALIKINEFFDSIKKGFTTILPYLLVAQDYFKLLGAFYSPAVFAATMSEMLEKYKDGVGAVFQQYKKDIESLDLATTPDTPTGPKMFSDEADATAKNIDRMKKDIQSLIEWLDNLGDKARKMAEDFAKNMERMADDFATRVMRFMEDWDIARARAIEDSNKNLEKKNKQHYDREYWEYLKFQERLRQLRERYLFNLEDALRERDARQVLRLGRQFAMDVENATNSYELAKAERAARKREDEAAAAQDLADKLKRLDEDRQKQLDRMREDNVLKEARAREDHKIAMDRLDDEIKDKLRKIADAWADEFELGREGAEGLYNLLNQYYGRGNLIDNLFFYMYESIIGTTKSAYEEMSTYVNLHIQQLRRLEEMRNRVYGGSNSMPHPGLYGMDYKNALGNLKGMPHPGVYTQITKTVEVKRNEVAVDVTMSQDLEYRIRRSVINDVNEVLVRFNRSRNRRFP
jgi:hypothetical protein